MLVCRKVKIHFMIKIKNKHLKFNKHKHLEFNKYKQLESRRPKDFGEKMNVYKDH